MYLAEKLSANSLSYTASIEYDNIHSKFIGTFGPHQSDVMEEPL